MSSSQVFRRCSRGGCGRKITKDSAPCPRCGGTEFSWAFRVTVSPPGAPRRQRLASGFQTKKAALDALAELRVDSARGLAVEPSKVTLVEYLRLWLEGSRSRYRPGAWETCRHHVETYIAPRDLAHVPLQQLTAPDVKAFVVELKREGRVRGDAPLSAKMTHNIFRTLCKALNDAVDDQLIVRNPAAKAHKMPESPEQPTWNAEQLRQFLAHEAAHRLLPLWLFVADSGVRRGEAAGLRWPDLDLAGARANLSHAHVKGDGGVVCGRLKGKRGRTVDLDARTVTALRVWRKQQAAERLAWPGEWGNDEDLVFTHEDGAPLHPDSITKTFQRRVAAASAWNEEWGQRCPSCNRGKDEHALPAIGPHGLRHTWASLALQAGVMLKVVQERLGHASVSITGDV